ncbi:hypothetical protein V2J09_015140 [Rumex salicifolius]
MKGITLDMSLEDLIKSRKTSSRGRGRGAPRGGRGGRGSFGGRRIVGSGPGRFPQGPQGPLRVNARPSAFTIAKASPKLWIHADAWFSPKRILFAYGRQSFRRTNIPRQHDLIEASLAAVGLPGIEDATKLHVSNLDHGVSNDDIRLLVSYGSENLVGTQELFSEIGELKRYAIHYGKNGQPSGSAEVVYTRRSDAFAAIKRYNNVRLDGRPMKIEIVTPKSELPVSARINVIGGVNGASIRRVVTTQGRGRPIAMLPPSNRGAFQRGRGGMRSTRGRGRGQGQNQARGGQGQPQGRGRGRGRGGKKQPKEKSADELDKELEKYHSEAMETNYKPQRYKKSFSTNSSQLALESDFPLDVSSVEAGDGSSSASHRDSSPGATAYVT